MNGYQSIDQYIWSLRYVDAPMVCLRDGNADGDVEDSYPTDWRRYYLTDANQNVTTTIRVDDDNYIGFFEAIARNAYTAYGTVERFGDDWTGTGAEAFFDGPMYAGYFFDTETGLYQVRNRYYDTGLSTFLNRDPIGYNSGDANLYRYVGSNPINAVDPSGLARKNLLKVFAQVKMLGKGTAEFVLKNGKKIKIRNAKFIGSWVSTKELAMFTNVSLKTIKAVNKKFPGVKIKYDKLAQPIFTPHRNATGYLVTNPWDQHPPS